MATMPLCVDADSDWKPRLSLSETDRQEYHGWALYADGIFKGIEQSSVKPLSKGIHKALEANPASNVLRRKWFEAHAVNANTKQETFQQLAQKYKPIFDKLPQNVDNAECYVKLLGNCRDAKSIDEFKQIIDSFNAREGRLLREYILHFSMQDREAQIDKKIAAWLADETMHDRWALQSTVACAWSMKYERLEKERRKADKERARQIEKEMAQLRKDSLELIRKVDIADIDEQAANIMRIIFEMHDCWQEAKNVLMAFSDTSTIDQRWWFDGALAQAMNVRDGELLLMFLQQVQFWDFYGVPELKKIRNALLSLKGQLAKAIDIQRILLERVNNRLEEQMFLAHMLLDHSDLDEAWELLKDIDRNKLALPGRLLINRAMCAKGNWDDAYVDLFAILSQHKLNVAYKTLSPDFFYHFANVCLKLGKNDEALEYAKTRYEMNPNNPVLCNFYGYLLADMNKDLPLAEKLIRKALKKDEKNVAFLDSLAWVYYRQKEFAKALSAMALVLELDGLAQDPDNEICGHLVDIYEALDMPMMAQFYRQVAAENKQ